MFRLTVTFSDHSLKYKGCRRIFEAPDYGVDGVGNLYLYDKPLNTLPFPRIIQAFYAPTIQHFKVVTVGGAPGAAGRPPDDVMDIDEATAEQSSLTRRR